jgi:hypothetical protein
MSMLRRKTGVAYQKKQTGYDATSTVSGGRELTDQRALPEGD